MHGTIVKNNNTNTLLTELNKITKKHTTIYTMLKWDHWPKQRAELLALWQCGAWWKHSANPNMLCSVKEFGTIESRWNLKINLN
jgi:hypothetical protein